MASRLLLACILAAAALIASASPALACSAGPGFDPSSVTQLLVLGRVRDLGVGPMANAGFREATVTVDVVWTFRGTASRVLAYVDEASMTVDPRTGRLDYAGGSGACGTIDRDPGGQYVLIALALGPDTRWHANRLFGATYGQSVSDVLNRWMLDRHGMQRFHIPFFASTPLLDAASFAVLTA